MPIDFAARGLTVRHKTDLASSSSGKGAAMVGIEGGGTLQDLAALSSFPAAEIARRSLPAAITAFHSTDRAGARWEEVPAGVAALPASGLGKWHAVDASGRRWWIASELTTKALGAAADGTTNDLPIIKELVEVAGPYFQKAVYISSGTHAIVRTTAADVIYVPAAGHIIFQPQAKLKGTVNIGGTGYYLPFIAIVEKTGATIEGANDKQFIFTGRLTYGTGQDFPVADITGVPTDTRLGGSTSVRADSCASGILVVASHNVTLIGLGCECVNGSSVSLGAAFCHGFISSAGNCHDLWYDNIDADDVVLGVVLNGGDGGGYGGFIRLGRASQDIGIPGHARYDFRRNVTFGPTVDTGEETGADLTRQISHSVSYGGSGPVSFGPIVSRRRNGPLNVKGVNRGATFDGIAWFPVALRSGGSEILPEQPRVYGVTSSGNSEISIRNMMIDCGGADVMLLGGDFGPGGSFEGTLVRTDTAATSYGFFSVAGTRQRGTLSLVQKGTVDPTISIHCGSVHSDSSYLLHLSGFVGNAPVVQIVNGSSYVTRTIFTIGNRKDSLGNVNPAFGDPAVIWNGSSNDNDRENNIMIYQDGTSSWYKDIFAGTTYTARFPIVRGSSLVDITVSCNSYTSASYFEHFETFLIRAARPRNRGGSAATVSTSLGAVGGLNNTAYTVTLTPALGYCDVSGNITGATPQANGARIFWTARRMSSEI